MTLTDSLAVRVTAGSDKVGVYKPGLPGVWAGYFYGDYDGNGIWEPAKDKISAFGGNAGDIPIIGDWNGSGTAKIGIIRTATGLTWYADYNGNWIWEGSLIDKVSAFGSAGDIPIIGDWNGDGKSKIGSFRQSARSFYLDYNGDWLWNAAIDKTVVWGVTEDLPIVGDWTGTGYTKIGTFRPSTGHFFLDWDGDFAWNGLYDKNYAGFGVAGVVPIIGDWNGDGKSKIGAFDPATGNFYLDYNGDGTYSGPPNDRFITGLGQAGDTPIIGDWNGDGRSKVGVWRPSTHTFYLDTNGDGVYSGPPNDSCITTFGDSTCLPVVGNWRASDMVKNAVRLSRADTSSASLTETVQQLKARLARADILDLKVLADLMGTVVGVPLQDTDLQELFGRFRLDEKAGRYYLEEQPARIYGDEKAGRYYLEEQQARLHLEGQP
jgi:hypothetical protein